MENNYFFELGFVYEKINFQNIFNSQAFSVNSKL